MDRGSSDEAIAYLRIKLLESDREVGAEGWNM